MTNISEIEARWKASTPGTWTVLSVDKEYGARVINPSGDAELGNWTMAERVRRSDDAIFIAHAHQDIPALIAHCEELKAKLAEAKRVVGFFASVIKSGESWTATCAREYRATGGKDE